MLKRDLFKKIIKENNLSKDEMRDVILAKAETSLVKKPRGKRVIITVAVCAVMLMMAGAGLRVMMMSYIDADGNIGFREWAGFGLFNLPQDEENIFWREFHEDNENMLVRVIYADEWRGTTIRHPHRTITDLRELESYFGGGIFELPQYLPDGYYFEEAKIGFFIDENFILENAELVIREEKFGNIYEKYYIPENTDNIEYINIRYRHSEQTGSFGKADYDYSYFINYSINLFEPEYVNMEITGWDNTKYEQLELPQFARAVISSTYFGMLDIPFTEYHFTGINAIDLKRGLVLGVLDGKEEYGAVWYRLNMTSYDESDGVRDEIIKMAESIK